MNEAKLAAIFLSGAAIGGTATYFALNRKLKVKYAEIAEEEIQSVRERLEEMTITDLEEFSKLQEPKSPGGDSEENIPDSPVEQALYSKQIREYSTADKTSVPYSSISTKKVIETKEVEIEAQPITDDISEKEDTPVHESQVPTGPIFLISEEDYSDPEWDEQSKVSLTYFEADDTLIDDSEYLIRDTDTVIGTEALTAFGRNPSEPDIVHVRNLTLRQDYEIARDLKSFEEVVLGLKPDAEVVKKFRSDE